MHVLALMMRRVFVSMLIDSKFNPAIGDVFAEFEKKERCFLTDNLMC